MVFPIHRALYKATSGVVGGRFEGRPMLLMTTIGRKTGKRRQVLIQYYPRGDDMVVVASNGGRDNHPAWLHNIRASPDVDVRVGRRSVRTRARVVDGAERDALWAELSSWYPGYPYYQTLTARRIEIVLLSPVS